MTRSFTLIGLVGGIAIFGSIHCLLTDLMGREAYVQWGGWVNSPWWIWPPVIITTFVDHVTLAEFDGDLQRALDCFKEDK